MNTEIDRKIAVIFVADVVGYSKHMEKDENATIKSYNAYEKILNKLLKKYKGSVFNTAGDSVLAEFPSAVNAVECGVDFQNEIKKRNQSDKVDVKLEFRLGINMGDVVKKDNNLIGDGVNIAARLEALAQPNGITISKSVYDFVMPKTKMTFNDLGVQKVKQNEFHAFDILLDPSQKRKLNIKPKLNIPLIGAIAAALIIAFVGVFYLNSVPEQQEVKEEITDTSKPIILVAPIKASGLSEDQKGFARGITESMVSTFSSYKGIRVLSSSTSFHSEKENMTDKAVRDEYGVNFIIRGSMQVMGENARLNLEITDSKIGEVVDTRKRDFKLSDIFSVQDQLSEEILLELQSDLGIGQIAKSWRKEFDTIEDFSLNLNWIRHWRSFTPEGHKKAQNILEDLKTRYSEDHPALLVNESWQLSQKIQLKLSSDKEGDLARLKYILDRNIELHPEHSDAYNARALIKLTRFAGECSDAYSDIVKAEKKGGDQETLLIGAAVYSTCGKTKEAIGRLRQLLEIIPNDPGWFQTGFLVTLLYRTKQQEEIYKLIGKNINAEDMDNRVLAIYAIFEFEKGNQEKAKSFFQKAMKKGFIKDRLTSKHHPEISEKTLEILDKIEKLT